jgi:hypothetical protein
MGRSGGLIRIWRILTLYLEWKAKGRNICESDLWESVLWCCNAQRKAVVREEGERDQVDFSFLDNSLDPTATDLQETEDTANYGGLEYDKCLNAEAEVIL